MRKEGVTKEESETILSVESETSLPGTNLLFLRIKENGIKGMREMIPLIRLGASSRRFG